MPSCDICGKGGALVDAMISGTKLSVCASCAKHGKILEKPKARDLGWEARRSLLPKKDLGGEAPSVKVGEDYASKIKRAREGMGLSHDELSKRIAEKESMLHKIESGHMEPPIAVARKLERFFGISIVEDNEEEEKVATPKASGGGFTLGDLIKKKD